MTTNIINISLGDMQLVQVDMLAELNGMNISDYIASLINREFGIEELNGYLDYKELHARVDERVSQKYESFI